MLRCTDFLSHLIEIPFQDPRCGPKAECKFRESESLSFRLMTRGRVPQCFLESLPLP